MIYADLSEDERARLRTAFESGFSTGSGCARQTPIDPALVELMDAVADDWFTTRETFAAIAPPQLLIELVPVWLRAYAERKGLLETPPDGWGLHPDVWPI